VSFNFYLVKVQCRAVK